MEIQELSRYFPYAPTEEQNELFTALDVFLRDPSSHSAFILKGYAGTGKTTVLSAVIKTLGAYKLKAVLLAPTGRAAKILSAYASRPAQTIHKKIYWKRDHAGGTSFDLGINKHTRTLFIVDEASMIAGAAEDEKASLQNHCLLDDLISYVYNAFDCRVLFLGDTAQLPPVGLAQSPALNTDYLRNRFQLDVAGFELREVVRQAADSGILENAVAMRDQLEARVFSYPQLTTGTTKDVVRIGADTLEDEISSAYSRYGMENTLVICRSNKSVNLFNHHIRSRILGYEEELGTGDHVMIVKNNYFWLPEDSELGFLANGDVARVVRLRNISEMYGFRFADAQLEFLDYPTRPELSCKVMLDTLKMDTPSMDPERSKLFYNRIAEDYAAVRGKKERLEQIKRNPWFNALQIKFAYAVTCHKAQGGQWDAVFVDQGYMRKDLINREYLRWLYTACTRAISKLYLVNFDSAFFSSKDQ